jgi:hypothetical protein
MRLASRLILLALAVGGLGCATSYRAGSKEGFSETRLSEDMFRVNFTGNGRTSAETVQDFGLLRAAELTQGSGFRYFAILREGRTAIRDATRGTTQIRYADSVPPVGHIMLKRYSKLTIQCFIEKPEGVHVFDAAFLCESIKAKYKIG